MPENKQLALKAGKRRKKIPKVGKPHPSKKRKDSSKNPKQKPTTPRKKVFTVSLVGPGDIDMLGERFLSKWRAC